MPQAPDLGEILSIARHSLSGTSNFTYGAVVQGILRQLVTQEVIEPPPPPFNDYHALHNSLHQQNPGLEQVIIEAFFYMFHRGFFVPESNAPNPPTMNRFHMTQKGLDWVNSCEPIPEDARGYMRTLKVAVPKLDPIVEQYLNEALVTYNRQAWFASAVMVGAAAEKSVYLLADALHTALTHPAKKKRLATAIRERKLPTLFEAILDPLRGAKSTIPYELQEGVAVHLFSFFEAIRVQRNDAVHPTVAEVTPERVCMTLAAFPQALAILSGLLEWLEQNTL